MSYLSEKQQTQYFFKISAEWITENLKRETDEGVKEIMFPSHEWMINISILQHSPPTDCLETDETL